MPHPDIYMILPAIYRTLFVIYKLLLSIYSAVSGLYGSCRQFEIYIIYTGIYTSIYIYGFLPG